jgi:hypothetical protein
MAESDKSDATPPVSQKAVDSAVGAYYEGAIGAVEKARQRAQTAFQMASAIAAAIAAAGFFADLGNKQPLVKGLAVGAFALWLVSAFLLLIAAVGEYRPDPTKLPKGATQNGGLWSAIGASSFMDTVLELIQGERNFVYDRIHRGLIAVALALLVTAVAIPAALLSADESKSVHGRVVFTKPAVALPQCEKPLPASVSARFDPAELETDSVELELDKGACQPNKAITIELPRAAIAGVTYPTQ